jgi:hypothetical protein
VRDGRGQGNMKIEAKYPFSRDAQQNVKPTTQLFGKEDEDRKYTR